LLSDDGLEAGIMLYNRSSDQKLGMDKISLLDLPFEVIEMILGMTRMTDLTRFLKSSKCIQVHLQVQRAELIGHIWGDALSKTA
jgi:hypothetical protein